MKKIFALLFLTVISTALLQASGLSREELKSAKQLYRQWKQNGTASPGQKHRIAEYLNHFRASRENEQGNPLDFRQGPDAFGYRWVDNLNGDTATYSWIDLCDDLSATDGPEGDDATAAAPIGFNFPFYGNNYDTLWINTNGLIDFNGPNADFDNICPFAVEESASPVIAVHWDDMVASDVGGCNSNANPPWIRYRSFGTYFVVEWKRLHHYDDEGDRFWFQAILYNDGKIKLQYRQITASITLRNKATVGIDAPGQNNGIEYCCNTNGFYFQNSNSVNRAVWFFRAPTQNSDFAVYTVLSPYEIQVPSLSLPVMVNIVNAGTLSGEGTVSYRWDNGAVETEPTITLGAGQVETHQFAASLATPAGDDEDTLVVWVNLTGDQDRSNDTTRVVVRTRECADYIVTAPYIAPHRSSCSGDDCDLSYSETQDDLYQVTIPYDGQWTFSTCSAGTGYDSYLLLSTVCCSDDFNDIIDENDDSDFDCPFDPFFSEINCIDLVAGTYFLHVEGFDDCGGYDLHIDACSNPPEPCDSVVGITAIRVGLTDSVTINFTAPQDGGYTLWKTIEKSNDGDPREGDPQWTQVATLFFNLGANSFIDPISVNYANYVITRECAGGIRSRGTLIK